MIDLNKLKMLLKEEISRDIKGKKRTRLLDSFTEGVLKKSYPTNPQIPSFNIRSISETAFQRAIFNNTTRLQLKSKIPNIMITWKDLELPVLFSENSRRKCIDLIGKAGRQLVICELKFKKASSKNAPDSPSYATLELLVYYYMVLKNYDRLDQEKVYHKISKNNFSWKWKDILIPHPLLIVAANKAYWDYWWSHPTYAWASLPHWINKINALLGTKIGLFKTKDVDFDTQRKKSINSTYYPKIQSAIWK